MSDDFAVFFGVGLIIGILLLTFLIGPIVLIFGLNLLGFSVPLSLKTWFGAFLVITALKGASVSASKKN